MFPSMNNTSDRRAVKNALEAIQEQYPPTNCLIEALYLCLDLTTVCLMTCNFLKHTGTTLAPHISCSYSEISSENFDKKALEYHLSAIG